MPQSTSTGSSASAEASAKREAVLEAVSRSGARGLVGTSFATTRWLLCGRGRPIVLGVAPYVVVVGEDDAVVAVPDIEKPRVDAEERFEELGYRVETFPWYEGPDALLAEVAERYAREDDVADVVAPLRRELRPEEVERYRAAGQDTAAAMVDTLRRVTPETTELEAAGELAAACERRGLLAPVLLAGGEGRQETFRHPIPTAARLGRHALLAVTGERDGLHVSATRIVSFGEPPDELRRRVRVAGEVDVAMLGASRPGTPVNDVLRVAAEAYERLGFPGEWRHHHQGGITGYAGREVFATPSEATPLPSVGAVAWNPSVAGGGKSEDTAVIGADGFEIVSRTPDLPEVEIDGVVRAGILVV